MKEKRCKEYCGVACVDGNCPIALYNEDLQCLKENRLARIVSITKSVRIVASKRQMCALIQPRKAVKLMCEIKIYCDHCGKVLNEMHDYPEQEIGFIGYETADLCNECLKELDKIIKAFCKKRW